MNNVLKRVRSYLYNALIEVKKNHGFSLLEIMVVIVIMSILVITVGPRLMDMPDKAKVSKAKEMVKSFELSLDRYALDNGNYPTTEQSLVALIEEPTSEPVPNNYNPGGYLKERSLPKDPWGRDFIYESPGANEEEYTITSLGADGVEGGEGKNADISN